MKHVFLPPFKLLLLVLANFVCLGAASGQIPHWIWARGSIAPFVPGGNECSNAAVDRTGNVVTTGSYAGAITFGNITLYEPGGGGGVFTVKYDPAGNVLWAKGGIGVGDETGYGIATDTAGNVFIGGWYGGRHLIFGNDTLINTAALDGTNAFITKYDSSGNLLWVKNIGGPNNNILRGLAVDAAGNVTVTGGTEGPTITFDNTTLNATGLFIAKYDGAGNLLWVKTPGGNFGCEGEGAATDINGNIYITGRFLAPTIAFDTITLTNPGGSPVFLVKYDAGGHVVWAKSAGGAQYDYGWGVATDVFGHVYMTGYFLSASITFGSFTLDNTNAPYECALFITKFDTSGNVIWAKTSGPFGRGWNMTTDLDGNVYLDGSFYRNTTQYIDTTPIVFEPQDTMDPLFIIKFDTAGRDCYLITIPSGGDDLAGIAADRWGNIYVSGDYMPNPFIIGSDTLSQSDLVENIFVAKLSPTIPYPGLLANAFGTMGDCNGQCNGTARVSAQNGAPPYTYLWQPGNLTGAEIDSLCAGTYQVTVRDSTGTTVTESVIIGVAAADSVALSVSDSIICAGDSAQLCATAGYTTYAWSNGQANGACFYTSNAGDYNVTVTDANGCTAVSNNRTLTVRQPQPVTVGVKGDTLTAYAAVSYQWFLNGSLLAGATSQIFIAQGPGTYSVEVTDTNGCSEFSTPVNFTNVDDIPWGLTDIYPNPAKDYVIVETDESSVGGTIQITDLAGREVSKSEIRNQKSEIPTSALSGGVYFVKVNDLNGRSGIKKLVIE